MREKRIINLLYLLSVGLFQLAGFREKSHKSLSSSFLLNGKIYQFFIIVFLVIRSIFV